MLNYLKLWSPKWKIFEVAYWDKYQNSQADLGGTHRTAATSKMERFVIIVNGWKPLTIITDHSIPDVATILDLSLELTFPTFFARGLCSFNPFQASVAFHIKTSNLIWTANQMTCFYLKSNTGLKWVKTFVKVFSSERYPEVFGTW